MHILLFRQHYVSYSKIPQFKNSKKKIWVTSQYRHQMAKLLFSTRLVLQVILEYLFLRHSTALSFIIFVQCEPLLCRSWMNFSRMVSVIFTLWYDSLLWLSNLIFGGIVSAIKIVLKVVQIKFHFHAFPRTFMVFFPKRFFNSKEFFPFFSMSEWKPATHYCSSLSCFISYIPMLYYESCDSQ